MPYIPRGGYVILATERHASPTAGADGRHIFLWGCTMQTMDFLAHQIAQGRNYHPMSEQTTVVLVETRPHIAGLIKEALEDSGLVVALANTIDEVQAALSQRRGFALLLVNVGAISSQGFSPQTRFGPSGALGTLQRISN